MKKFLFLGVVALFGLSAYAHPNSPDPAELSAGDVGVAELHHGIKVPDGVNLPVNQFTKEQVDRKLAKVPTQLPAKAKRNADGDDDGIYAFIGYAFHDMTYGFYRLSPSSKAMEFQFVDDLYRNYWIIPVNVWYTNQKLAGVTVVNNNGYIDAYVYYEMDANNGKLTAFTDYGFPDYLFWACDYNPEDDRIYGVVCDNNINKWYWGSAPSGSPDEVEIAGQIASGARCDNVVYNPVTSQFYAVNYSNQFVSIDPRTGMQTVISTLPKTYYGYNWGGITWDNSSQLFYYLPSGATPLSDLPTTYMLSIDLKGDYRQVHEYWPQAPTFTCAYSKSNNTAAGQPEAPLTGTPSFSTNKQDGSVAFTMPSTFGDGTSLPSSISYTTLLDGEEYSKGTAKPGEVITVEYKNLPVGNHSFSCYVTVNGVNSFRSSSRKWIGNDTPKAPGIVGLGVEQITWERSASTGVHNGYVQAAQLSYNVYLDDELIATGIKTTSVTLEKYGIDLSDGELMPHYAAVEAVCNGLTSAKTYSAPVVAGEPYILPMDITPTPAEAEMLTIIDENGDGNTWFYNSDWQRIMMWSAKEQNAQGADDYVWLPPVLIDNVEDFVRFQMDCWSVTGTSETIEVVYAKAPSSSAKLYYITSGIAYEGEFHVDELFRPAEAGIYYIGVHSLGGGFRSEVGNFLIEQSNVTNDSPAAVENLKFTPAPQGKLQTDVEFNLPLNKNSGSALSSTDKLDVVITVNGIDANVNASGYPGEPIKVTVNTRQGDNTIIVRADLGQNPGVTTTQSVFTGISLPHALKEVRVKSADITTATLEWDPVTEPADEGGYINPANITYYPEVWLNIVSNNVITRYWVKLVDEPIKETTFTFDFTKLKDTNFGTFNFESAPQDVYGFWVFPCNEAGMWDTVNSTQLVYLFMGAPYYVPFVDEFKTSNSQFGNSEKGWVTLQSILDYQCKDLFFSAPVSNGFAAFADADGQNASEANPVYAALGSPVVTTIDAEDVQVGISVNQGPNTASFEIIAQTNPNEDGYSTFVTVAEVAGNQGESNGYNELTFDLPESLYGYKWVRFIIIPKFTADKQTFSMNYFAVNGTDKSGVESVGCEFHGIDTIYNLQGLPVSNPLPGQIYIVNGKKVIY